MGKSKKTQKQENALIKLFVEDCFDRYYLNNIQNLFKYDKNGHRSLPLFTKDGMSETILQRSAKMLGITTEEILNCDEGAAQRWYKKYSFFKLYGSFLASQNRAIEGDEIRKARLIKAILGKEIESSLEQYDSKSIYKRMIEVLKDADKNLSGIYRAETDIVDFSYETEQFFSFPKIGELLGALLDLINRAKELFFKAWDEDFTESEKAEYNFLVTFLDIVDNYVPHKVYYENLKSLISVYRKERFKGEKEEFLNLVHLKFCSQFTPWACKEFAENFELAQLYAAIYPYAKRRMFDFGSSVKYFNCRFKWLNDKNESLDIDDEDFADVTMESINAEIEQDIAALDSLEQNGVGSLCGWNFIRVPKTKDELNGDEIFAEKLIRLGGVPAKGGIRIPIIKRDKNQDVNRMFIRMSVWGESL